MSICAVIVCCTSELCWSNDGIYLQCIIILCWNYDPGGEFCVFIIIAHIVVLEALYHSTPVSVYI